MATGKKSLLQHIKTFLENNPGNPYREGCIDFWRNNSLYPVFKGRTLAGFKINYKVTLHIDRVNNAEFIASRMLEEKQIDTLTQEFNEDFLRWMRETKRHFYLDMLNGIGDVIHITDDGIIEDEINCSSTTKAFNKHGFVKHGCRVRLILCDVWIDENDEALIGENCDMIDEDTKKSLEDQLGLRKRQETWTVILMQELIKIQKAWKKQIQLGANRTYTGKWIEVQIENQGNEVVLRWKYKQPSDSGKFHLRGFRKEGAFALAQDDESQGALVIDCWGPDWRVEHLETGKTYYYTMKISYLGNKKDSIECEQEVIRFEITTPNMSVDDFEQRLASWVKKIQGGKPPAPDPERESVNRAFKELSSYVEFDESITQLEKDLINKIGSKGYSAKERKEKIERLKCAVEDVRMKHL